PGVNTIEIQPGDGNNTVNIESTWGNTVTSVQGSSSDTVNISSLAPLVGGTLQNILGPVNVNLNSTSGSATLNISDAGNTTIGTAYMGTVFGNPGLGYIDGLAPVEITYGYAHTASLTINTSSANGDVFDVRETAVPTNLISRGATSVSVGDGTF